MAAVSLALEEKAKALFSDDVAGEQQPVFDGTPALKPALRHAVHRAYENVSGALGKIGKYFKLPQYIAVGDFFSLETVKVRTPEGDLELPVGIAKAFYNQDNGILALDAVAIPGSAKNELYKDIFRYGIQVAGTVGAFYSHLNEKMNRLKEFYRNAIKSLDESPVKSATHELLHHVITKIGLGKYLDTETHEGLVETAMSNAFGCKTTRGTTYDGFRKGVTRVLDKIGYYTGIDFIVDAIMDPRKQGYRLAGAGVYAR